MKVGQIPGVAGVYNKQGISKVERAKEAQGKKDVVAISNAGQDYNAVIKALKDVPEIREDKVNAIKEQIENNDYNVDRKELTDAVVEEFFGKKA